MKRYKLLLILLSITLSVSAQDNIVVTSDFESWSTIGISKKIGDFKLSLDENLRLHENSTSIDKFFTDVGVSYKINKYIKLGTNYRFYRNKTTSGDYKNQHRFSGDLKLSYGLDRFDFSYRARLQNKDEDFYKSDLSDNNVNNFRNKLQVEYDIKKTKFEPYVSAELFRRFGDSQADYFNKYRLTIGMKYELKKIGEFNLFYRFDKELNSTYPKSTYIVGLGYSYKFK